MTGPGLLNDAVAQLYASDLDVFTELRGVLAARARAAGDAPTAKAIAGLRKPTRSAWVINQLVRADPSVASRLVALGDELRTAEAALDGARIRELSLARRQLTTDLVRDALALSGPDPAPAALREEVTATLGAALADPQVAEQMAAGTLLRAAHRAGFGSGVAALATALPVAPARSGAKADPRQADRERAESDQAEADRAERERTERERAEAERAEAERKRSRTIAEAEQVAADADRAADAAAEAEREQESAVRRAEEQLAEARQRLAEARLQTHGAKSAQREALKAVGRLQIASSDSLPERRA